MGERWPRTYAWRITPRSATHQNSSRARESGQRFLRTNPVMRMVYEGRFIPLMRWDPRRNLEMHRIDVTRRSLQFGVRGLSLYPNGLGLLGRLTRRHKDGLAARRQRASDRKGRYRRGPQQTPCFQPHCDPPEFAIQAHFDSIRRNQAIVTRCDASSVRLTPLSVSVYSIHSAGTDSP